MQSADFEDDLFKNWFRRPTIFMACAWFLLATAGRIALRVGLGELTLLASQLGFTDLRGYSAAAADMLYHLGLLAFPVLWYAARHPGVDQAMRLKPPHPLPAFHALLLGAAAVPLAACLTGWWNLLIQAAGGALPEAAPAPSSPAALARALLLNALLPGVCEELVFRGGVMGAWERRGSERAVVVSSLMFAALHGSVQGLPVQLVMGFALGYLVLRSGSLWSGVICHIAFNAGTLLFSYMYKYSFFAHIYTFIQSGAGLSLFIADTVASAALFGLLLVWLKKLCERFRLSAPKAERTDTAPLDTASLIVLCAGMLTAAIFYMEDILRLCGVL